MPTEPARALCVYLALVLLGCDARPLPEQTQTTAAPRPVVPQNADLDRAVGVGALRLGGTAGLDLSGKGILVAQWDEGGLLETHDDLQGRASVLDDAEPTEHATHVAGTIIGSGAGNVDATGIATSAYLWSFSWQDNFSEMVEHGNWIVASNHSYGLSLGWGQHDECPALPTWFGGDNTEDPLFGKYGASAAAVDESAVATDHLIVWAAGNDRVDVIHPPGSAHFHYPSCDVTETDDHASQDGFDTLGGYTTAKNSLVVGATLLPAQPLVAADVEPMTESAFGPTDDGRIKPDIAAPGESVVSASAAADDAYFTSAGTSSAAAVVTGIAALLVELYRTENNERDPRAAELKAVMIHTARDIGPAPGPDYRMGYGLVDAKAAASLIERDTEGTQASRRIRIGVATDGRLGEIRTSDDVAKGTPFRVTLAWADPAAASNEGASDDSEPALVNNLDLELESPDGTLHFPWALNRSSPDAAATRDEPNRVDNVEVVDVSAEDNTIDGKWIVRVRIDGAVSNNFQEYALVSDVPLEPADDAMIGTRHQLMVEAPAWKVQRAAVIPIESLGDETLDWAIRSNVPWLVPASRTGQTPAMVEVDLAASDLSLGWHLGRVTVSSDDPSGSRTVGVALHVNCSPACGDLKCGVEPECGVDCGSCDDGDPCTADACTLGACEHSEMPNCCVDSDACPPLATCTSSECIDGGCALLDGGTCIESTSDASVPRESEQADSGRPMTEADRPGGESGCGCRVGPVSSRNIHVAPLALSCVLALLRMPRLWRRRPKTAPPTRG